MAGLQRYYLNFIFLFLGFLGCNNYTSEERKELSKQLFEKEFGHHNHLGPKQGSPQSMTLLDSILSLDSTNAAAWRELSVPYLKRGMPLEWKPIFEKAVAYDPKTWVPIRGYLYLMFYRNYKMANLDFNSSDTLTPFLDYPQGHSVDYWRGIAYLGLKDFERAVYFWDKHILRETQESGEDWVELEAFLYRGITHYEKGNLEKALEDFDRIVKYFRTSAETNYYYAKIYLELGNKKKALEFCEKAISDLKNKLGLHHNYVEMPKQVYLSDVHLLQSEIMATFD